MSYAGAYQAGLVNPNPYAQITTSLHNEWGFPITGWTLMWITVLAVVIIASIYYGNITNFKAATTTPSNTTINLFAASTFLMGFAFAILVFVVYVLARGREMRLSR